MVNYQGDEKPQCIMAEWDKRGRGRGREEEKKNPPQLPHFALKEAVSLIY